ncbi:hypothetical protein FM109_18010 [Vibrio casei]|nr:hypothetical protein FM109_18010 [Vibrio casei]
MLNEVNIHTLDIKYIKIEHEIVKRDDKVNEQKNKEGIYTISIWL